MATTAKQNPFRAARLDALDYEFQEAGTNWDSLFSQLEKLHLRAALIGAKGCGKTTLMSGFAKRLRNRNWQVCDLRLSSSYRDLSAEQWQKIKTLTQSDFVLLDGCEQLNFLKWRRFLHYSRHAGGLLISTHRAGRLRTLFECRTSPQLLQVLLEKLASETLFPNDQARYLYHNHQGNIREVLRALYEQQALDFTEQNKNDS